MLDKDPAYKTITSMNRQLLPDEFKRPLTEERRALEQEIRKRSRSHNQIKTQLERKIAELERATNAADSQLNALLEQITREQEMDAGENTVDLKKPEEEEPAQKTAPAEKK